SCWYYEHRLPVAPERYGEMLRVIVRDAGAEETEAGKHILALASRYRGLRHPNRQEAPQLKAELKGISGGAGIIARGLSAYRAGADRPAERLGDRQLLGREQ